MKISLNKIITGIVIVLSAYVISLDIFFFMGHFLVPVFDDSSSAWARIFVYTLVILNLLIVLLIFVLTAKNKFYKSKKLSISLMLFLLAITMAHLAALYFEISNNDVLYALQPLSVKTLALLLICGILFFCKSKEKNLV